MVMQSCEDGVVDVKAQDDPLLYFRLDPGHPGVVQGFTLGVEQMVLRRL